jgi:ANTAR domain
MEFHPVVVEQAKGLLREVLDISVDDAYDLLCRYAQANDDQLMCPGLYGVGLLDFWSRHPSKEPCPCPSVIPKSSAARCSTSWLQVALSLRLQPTSASVTRRSTAGAKQELIDTGQLPGVNRAEQAELSAANKRIRELETEVAILKRARELLREPHDPKGDMRP